MLLCCGLWSVPALAASYRVCVQNIDYYPHYDFSVVPGRGYAADLFALFTLRTGIKLQLVPLPVKRLQDNPDCALVYPDNPLWHSVKKERAEGEQRLLYFSQPLIWNVGATMVRKGEAQLTISKVRAIAVTRGFTPDHLLAVQSEQNFALVETADATAALLMLLKKRVDAADVEWHVARHLLAKAGVAEQAEIGQQLPFTSVGFHLSSHKHQDLLHSVDRFLLQHAAEVQSLKQRYKLQTVAELIAPAAAGSQSIPPGH